MDRDNEPTEEPDESATEEQIEEANEPDNDNVPVESGQTSAL